MDNFNVPKKVNRHVLKALNYLSAGNYHESITTTRILNQVKFQMRNLVPVYNVDSAIQKSLKNMSEIGLIERHGTYRYAMGRCYAPPPQQPPNTPDRRIFRGTDPRKQSRSRLDPNIKRIHHSEDSISGDEFDRTRKRMRSNNKQLKYTGRTAALPRARQHRSNQHVGGSRLDIYEPMDTPLFAHASPSLPCHPLLAAQHQHHRQHNSRGYFDLSVSSAKSSNCEFLLATLTPVPSLEITEISAEIKKVTGVREIVETPTMEQQEPMHVHDNKETTTVANVMIEAEVIKIDLESEQPNCNAAEQSASPAKSPEITVVLSQTNNTSAETKKETATVEASTKTPNGSNSALGNSETHERFEV